MSKTAIIKFTKGCINVISKYESFQKFWELLIESKSNIKKELENGNTISITLV